MDPDGDFGRWVTPDDLLDARIADAGLVERKMEALRQHRSQVAEDDFFFKGAESGGSHFAEEYFRLAKGERGPVGPDGLEEDLFAGLDTSAER
jgi:N-acetyl-1-D-myo-inositol-2-amino-2-deoxy-alpha-D-glucopyranoside deacetylase